jgi:hypothetical protein
MFDIAYKNDKYDLSKGKREIFDIYNISINLFAYANCKSIKHLCYKIQKVILCEMVCSLEMETRNTFTTPRCRMIENIFQVKYKCQNLKIVELMIK